MLEFIVTALTRPSTVSYHSFILNHSKEYSLAFLASLSEFWIEAFFFREWKLRFVYLNGLGLLMLAMGQVVRSTGMWYEERKTYVHSIELLISLTVIRTCGKNFAHQIMVEKAEGHQLITHGVYAYLRHPSYFGFFYWSVGSQLFLLNPICLAIYAFASWKFFSARIPYEESLLLQFYGEDYLNYMKRTIIGIPLIPTIRDRFR